MEPQGGTDHRFFNPLSDTSLCCEAMDTKLVHHVMPPVK